MSGTFNVFSVIYSLLSIGRRFLNPEEPLDGGGEFFYLLLGVLAVLDGLPHAVLDVVLQEYGAHLLQGCDDAGDLGEDVYAVGFLVHHPLHPPHLALDPPEAVLKQLLVLSLYVAVGGTGRRPLVSLRRVYHTLPFY